MPWRPQRSSWCGVLGLIGLGATTTYGATLRVPAEYPTINDGLRASVSGDTVLVAPGIYTDSDNVDGPLSCARLVGGVKLLSEGGPEATTIDMEGAYEFGAGPVKAFSSDEPMWIEGFTVTGSPQGRPGIEAGGIPKLTVKNCVIRDLDGVGGVSGAYIDLDVIECHFVRLRSYAGAGISVGPSNLRVVGSVFEECENIAIQMTTNEFGLHDESIVIENSRFLRNHSSGDGGAMVGAIRGDITVRNCWFEENTAGSNPGGVGGAMRLTGPWGARVVEECVFWKNEALSSTSWGGAIFAAITTQIVDCTFVGNSQGQIYSGGSAVTVFGGSCELRNSIVAASQNHHAVGVLSGALGSSCNVFWDNEFGVGDDWTPDPTDLEADPRFCDPETGNFTLSSDSACLPENNPFGCDRIGALGEGCGGLAVESASWGAIKSLYRDGGESRSRADDASGR